jgi:sarcosine oxidase
VVDGGYIMGIAMSASVFDVIVLGCGGMGSAAAYELAWRGRRVLALEQFALGHDRGSSHGRTRVIRQAYYEHPDYVPLVRRAYERWYSLEQEAGRRLLTECACLNLGPPDRELIQGVRRSCEEHRLPVAVLAAEEVRRRFPVFRPEDHWVGVLEPTAGFLAVEDCVAAHAEAAARRGAVVCTGERVVGWEAAGPGVTVTTERATYQAGALVVTAGPWAAQALGRLGAKLAVMRQVMLWFATADAARFRRDVCPIYLMDSPAGFFYGLPQIDPLGHKAARHYGADELADPAAIDRIDRTVTEADAAPVRDFLRRYVPDAAGDKWHGQVCVYTLTPDRTSSSTGTRNSRRWRWRPASPGTGSSSPRWWAKSWPT